MHSVELTIDTGRSPGLVDLTDACRRFLDEEGLPLERTPDEWGLTASNSGAGSGTLTAGPATGVIQLKLNGEVLDEIRLPITLEEPPA